MAIFCIPFTFTLELLQTWVFTAPMCPIVLFLQLVSVTGSVSTNMAIGIDRLWAVAYPLKSRLTHSRYKLTIAIIWGIAVCLSSVQLVVGRVKNDNINGVDIVRCSEEWPEPSDMLMKLYTMFILFITYIVPLTILTITYTIVGRLLSQRQTPGNADEFRDTQQLRSKRKVVKMLITIVLVFGLCWLPLHIFMLLIHFSPSMLTYMSQSADLERLLQGIYFSVHWLAMSNSFVNPIIYGSMNESFRADLRCLLIGVFPCLEKCCGRKYTFATLSSRRRLPGSNSSGQKMLEKNTTVRLLAARTRPHGARQNYITNGNCIHPKGAFLDKADQPVMDECEDTR
ncbi:RYamide receptor-like [Liolophura sinensis]|uniref:RYamide receptor-like n=1 Tax=Liolophura sinensis TaxID=3198878 RepID=UPI0031597C67